MGFNIGDIVRIKKGTEHYLNGNNNNPKDMDGTVCEYRNNEIFTTYKYKVKWTNGEYNHYRDEDLVLVSSKKDVNNEESLKKENAELKAEIERLKKEGYEKDRYITELHTKLTPKVVIAPISEDKVEPKKRRLI